MRNFVSRIEGQRVIVHPWLTRRWMVLFLMSTSCISSLGGDGASRRRGITPEDETILSITLGKSTAEDVTRTLGVAPARETSLDHEISTSCYLGKDGTVLEFSYWVGEPIEFRLAIAPDEGSARCADSALVSRELATASGLKLGLSKQQVIRKMGSPSRKSAGRYVYAVTIERPPTAEETSRFKTKGGPPWEVETIQITQKIEIVFRKTKVVSIRVVHSETI